MTQEEISAIRQAIIDALPNDTSLHGKTPEQREVYTPSAHIKALRLESSIVIGIRGVGKTFWSAALRSDAIRKMLGGSVPDLSLVKVYTGFGENPNLLAYPDDEIFSSLVKKGFEPYYIWRAVLGRWAAGIVAESVPVDSWDNTVSWVKAEPEQFGKLLEGANAKCENDGTHGLIVFDALDRSSNDWRTMDLIVRDLLRIVLMLKRFARLHAKVFLRQDQFEGRPIADFPDASKILATRVELTWEAHDLHGLLWQYLCNGKSGKILREVYKASVGKEPQQQEVDVWTIDESAKREGVTQRSLFQSIAGEWMGRDRRRGVPYTWSVGHLADGRGLTSPRSFLAAIRAAAENSHERYPDHPYPLHFESIKRGVQKASEIRVSELAEDYPWIKNIMAPLKGCTVPCYFETFEENWKTKFGATPESIDFKRLPPEHYKDGWAGVRRDVVSLGVFEVMKDGRINMPDLYRVGFGLGRRGGVRPMTKSQSD